MGITFQPYTQDACCLCGSKSNLSGEHKIKASTIRAEFGADAMVIGRFGKTNEDVRPVQGPKSKELHFEAKLCQTCNSSRTQGPDLAFDNFHKRVRGCLENGQDPNSVFDHNTYAIGSDTYLNVFRYFAKLLCCHLAEAGGPRPVYMSRFATGIEKNNRIRLSIDQDPIYSELSKLHGLHQYAAHGGLIVYGNKSDGGANGFHSTLTIGPIRYTFGTRLNWFEKLELKFAHSDFHQFCQKKVREAIEHS